MRLRLNSPLLLVLAFAGRAGAEAPSTAPATDSPPRALACLSKWYPVEPVKVDGAWHVKLGGATYPWDDGKTKSFEEKLASPDLEDTFSIPYTPGPIQPVTRENEDPGRIRFEPLFHAAYGDSVAKVDVVELDFLGQTLKVNRKAAPAFERVAKRLDAAVKQEPSLRPYLQNLGGNIAHTSRQSAHSYGVSIDVNVKRSHYWEWAKPKEPVRWANQIPRALVDAFEAEGFIWGGRWYHYDTMHFEYRPELLDAACR
jgi:hypothetical protein